MILQSLVSYYESLLASGKIAAPGWSLGKVSYTIIINDSGEITGVIPLKENVQKGKKTVLLPINIKIPKPTERTSGVAANFLCDHSGYILGVDAKGNPTRSADCFSACRELHEEILSGVDSPAAKAVLAFFDSWKPDSAAENPVFKDVWDDLISGGNIVFTYDCNYVHDDPAVMQAWQTRYESAGDEPVMTCLVTGKTGPTAATHPVIKGIAGAQSSGASLVSFNAPAFCSYGKEQSFNAPTGKDAAFAYTSALN